MNFQQLRSVRETQRRDFNLTDVAQALHTSQPGISRQIRDLEEELGFELFMRAGKRLTGLTEPGAHVLPIIERLLLEADNLRQAADEFAQTERGVLRLAATHGQARYMLPEVIRDFRRQHPEVRLTLQQGSPEQVAALLRHGDADIGIATEALSRHADLVALPCYRWSHVVVVPLGHGLLDRDTPLDLASLAREPLVTYEPGYTGRSHLDEAFAAAGLQPDIVLSAMDADVIKTYVELGLGVGLVASIAFDPERDTRLRALEARHLFGDNLTRIAVRRGAYLRDYAYRFIQTFAPPLDRAVVDAARHDLALAA